MSAFEPYIIIDLDQGRRCYTRGDPVIKTFENEEYSFVSGVSDIRLPGSSVNPGTGSSLGSGLASVTIFNDGLTPGSLLSTYSRVQGCRLRVYVEERSGASILAFDGEVNSVKHTVQAGTITLEGGPVHDTIAVPFPSATTLEEGRLITRESKQITFTPQAYTVPGDAFKEPNSPNYAPAKVEIPKDGPRSTETATFIWLKDAMEFKSIFGTPSAPRYAYADNKTVDAAGNPRVVFQQTQINQLDGSAEYGTITDPNTFLWWESSAKDDPIPVIYGDGINMPMRPFAHYRVTYYPRDEIAAASKRYAKVYIYPVACHSVVGDPRLVTQDKSTIFTHAVGLETPPDFFLALRWGDNHYAPPSLSSAVAAYPGGQAGYDTTDRLNSPLAYVTLAVPYKPPSDIEGQEVEEWEEILDDFPFAQYKDFEPGRVWALMCKGKQSTRGRPITGLGDVIRDAWTTFGAAGAQTVDWSLSSLATSRLNAYAVDMVVNGSKEDQTLERVLNSRVSKQFPVAFGFPRGKTAWQCTALPLEAGAASRLLVLGEDLVERVSVTESSRTSIQNAVTVTFGMDGARAGTRFTVVADHTNNNTCRASVSRWGRSQRNKLSLPDSQDAPTAARIANEFVEQSAGVRITAQYLTDDASFLHMPMFTVVGVTDLEAGFDEERFFYLGYEWGADLTTLSIKLLSVSMV